MISNTLWLRKRAQNFLSPNVYPLTSTHPHQQSPPPHVNGHYHHLARQWTTTCWPHSSSKFFFSFFSLNAIITSHSSPSASITCPYPCPSASVTIRIHHLPPSVPIRIHHHPHPLPVAPTTTVFTRVEGQPYHRASLPMPTSNMFYFILFVALLTITISTATTCMQHVRTHIQVSIILHGTH